MNRCGCASSWTASVPERWVSNSHHSQPFGHAPLFQRKGNRPAGRLSGLGSSLPSGNRTHTRRLYFGWRHSSTLPLEQQYINIFQICWSQEQEHGSLYIINWTFNQESKIQSSGQWAKSNSVFYIKLPLAPLILKNYTESRIQMSAWTLYLLQKPTKWSCSWLWLYLSFQVTTFTEIDKQSQEASTTHLSFSCG